MKKTLLVSAVITLLLSLSVSAQEDTGIDETKEQYELDNKEKALLDQNTTSYRINKLKDLYADTAQSGSAKFDRSYLIDEPLQLKEVVDFNHPYLDVLLSELTEDDRDAIIKSVREDEAKNQRNKSILLTAMKFGTDASVYKRTRDFHNKLRNEYYSDMNQIFPFWMLSLEDGKIKPPVIEEIGFTREIEDKRTRREIRKRYRIAKQAEVINEPQDFIDFFGNLMREKPRAPNVYMLPINEEELKHWRKGILNGWVEGNRLANRIIQEDIRKLIREFNGQLRFHYLARANIVSRPTSKDTNIGTNTGGNVVNVGESVFEITRLPEFNGNDQTWIAIPQVDDIFDKLTSDDVDELTKYLDHAGDLR